MLAGVRSVVPIVMLIFAASCSDLDEFRTDPSEVFRGTVIGSESDLNCPGGACSFIRRGFPPGTRLSLRFDPTQSNRTAGTLTSDDDACGTRIFDEAPLLPIEALPHDQLSLYDFPGSGRLRNYIFVVQPPSGPLAGRDTMVFLSLLRGGGIEARIIAGSGRRDRECSVQDCARWLSGECDFFGVFSLAKVETAP